jgi:hypothetical protein
LLATVITVRPADTFTAPERKLCTEARLATLAVPFTRIEADSHGREPPAPVDLDRSNDREAQPPMRDGPTITTVGVIPPDFGALRSTV